MSDPALIQLDEMGEGHYIVDNQITEETRNIDILENTRLRVINTNDRLSENEIRDFFSNHPIAKSQFDKYLPALLEKSREWFEKRCRVLDEVDVPLDRLLLIGSYFFINDDIFDLIIDKKWSTPIKQFAFLELVNKGCSINNIEKIMQLASDCVPEELQGFLFQNPESQYSSDLGNLLIFHPEYFKKLYEMTPKNEWVELIKTKEKSSYYLDLFDNATSASNHAYKDYDSLSDRNSLPLEFDDEPNEHKEEWSSLVSATGFGEMAKKIVKKLTFGKSRKNSQNSVSGEIEISSTGPHAIAALFHELGHALYAYIKQTPKLHKFLYEYVFLISSQHSKSSYAEAYAREYGYNSTKYISESLAEDLRYFFFFPEPELIPADRLNIIESLVTEVFPNINPSQIRKKIRITLGNFYGIGIASKEIASEFMQNFDRAAEMNRAQIRQHEKRTQEKIATMKQIW